MTMPFEIIALVDRLNQEIEQIKQDASIGLNLLRVPLSLFPNNAILIRYFAYFNNILFFAEMSKTRIQSVVESISSEDVTVLGIQEAGEDLGELLGKLLESKAGVSRIVRILQE